jgi:hypothetical protein
MQAVMKESEATTVKVSRNGHFTEKGYGNCTFRGPLEALPRPDKFDLETCVEMMYTDGYCIVPNALSRAEVAELKAVIDSTGGPDEQYNVKHWCFNKHVPVPFTQDPRVLKCADMPGVIDVIYEILGPTALTSWGNFWVTGPGREMGIHVDYLPLSLPQDVLEDPRVRVPIFTPTAHLYLDDQVPELGPTLMVPGSHRSGRAPNNETSFNGVTPKAALVKAGDVVIFRPEVWHGAWMNSSPADSRRYIMQIFYGYRSGHGFPAMRYSSLWNPECIKAATPRQKKLLGG